MDQILKWGWGKWSIDCGIAPNSEVGLEKLVHYLREWTKLWSDAWESGVLLSGMDQIVECCRGKWSIDCGIAPKR
ncbi:hypothetical protein D3H55_10685 [Bacillus salacetis]|uniref:Uncharacterized protein n=1 Tax=Bacillus salacetis TaxID=2315464 RepID=A0A3A1QYZ6_9BACI|nr:hypothetical protein [Bacillus salacetis]RIW34051.1 hypothetical protein D3H55_10685 [Bacillus salacetis]